MKVEEAIKIISNKLLGKEDSMMLKVYKIVLQKGRANGDDLCHLQNTGLPIVTLFSQFKSIPIYEAREDVRLGGLTASDLEQILINYAQSKA